MRDLVVILLAGGRSSRFWPLEHKNLLPFLGKSLIFHQIETLKRSGLGNIVVVSNKDTSDTIRAFGVEVVVQKGQGIAAALISAKDFIKGKSVLIVIANDFINDEFFQQINDRIKISKETNFLVAYKTKYYLPMGYVDIQGEKVTKIVEKPDEGKEPSSYINISSHFHKNADKLLSYLTKTISKKDDVYEQAISKMINDGEIFESLFYDGSFAYLKYSWHTLLVMDYFLSKIKDQRISKSAKIDKNATISGPVWIDEEVRVMEYAKIVGPVYIGRNTIIGNNTMIRYSHIGQHSVIGFGSDIARSYLGAICWLHSNYVGDSVLGENVGLGSGTILANLRLDEKEVPSSLKQERISSKREKLGAIIGDNVRIGVNSSVMPGVKIGKNCLVGAGVILQKDLSDNKRCFIKQSHIIKNNVASVTVNKRKKFRKKI